MNDFLFVKYRRKTGRPFKHPYRNSRSKVQRLRRARERKIKFKAILQQNVAEWLQKCFDENSAIQDKSVTKTKEILDPVELDEDDLYYFSNFLIFDEPVEETINDLVKQVEYKFKKTNDCVQESNSECSENEVSNYDNNGGSDLVAKSAVNFLHNSTSNSLRHGNIQLNDESTKTDSSMYLSNIKKEIYINDDVTFSSESYNTLQEEMPSIKMETDSLSSFHSRDEILSVNSLHVINQENTSPLNKNYEMSSSIIHSNMPCTTNCCIEYHAERNDNFDSEIQFVKLEFQEIDCGGYTKTCHQETDFELIQPKTRAHVMEEPKKPKETKRNYKVAALNGSTKWKGCIVDYSRTNREILNEKLNANRLIIRNFLYHPQNPLSLDICEENEMSVETSRNLKEKDKKYTANSLKYNMCIKESSKKAQKIDLEDESYKMRHIFDPDFGRIKISDMRDSS